MASAAGASQSGLLHFLAVNLPKPISRCVNTLLLRPHLRVFLIALFSLIAFIFMGIFADTTDHAMSVVRLPPPQQRSYASSLVSNCEHRTPSHPGRTFETKVRGARVSFVSWTKNETFDKDIINLRTHEAVRIMSKFRRPATLLDVGANIGKVTFPVLAMPHTHSVIAVEPVEANINLLCMTANLNGWLGNAGLYLLKAAMSDKSGSMDIFVPEGREDNAALNSEAATANVHEHKHGEPVRVLVADHVLRDSGLKPDVIKIDTQGHEIHVLRGLRGYLRNAEPGSVLVMAESDPKLMRISGVDPSDIYQLMATELGYSPYCKTTIDVDDEGKLRVKGDVLSKEEYPPGGCRDIYYFKQPK